MKHIPLNLILFLFIGLTATGVAQEKRKTDETLLRILSFNILHGATTQGDFDLEVIADVIHRSNPDLVALQEVDYKTNRARKLDLTTELALRTDMTSFFARAMFYDGGEYGEGILSKWTFLEAKSTALPHQPESEPRAAAVAKMVMPSGDTIQFIATHLDHLKEEQDRMMQTRAINQIIRKEKVPTVLAGDLNDVPGSQPIDILESQWGASYDPKDPQPTFPSAAPEVKIDYVMFYPKNRWEVVERRVICDQKASDHCAYLTVLKLID